MNDLFHPAGLPAPEPEAAAHGRRAAEVLRRRIERGGPMPFFEYMEFCLHDPRFGYYPAGSAKLGPAGDFVTAPEISSLFGCCVARQLDEILEWLGGGEVLEIGGGTGAFAASCLAELARSHRRVRRYRILETSADLRARQQTRLAGLGVTWLDRLPKEPFEGVVFANEVADALPVERFRIGANGIESLCVGLRTGGFEWTTRPAGPALAAHVRGVEQRLARRLGPPGYETEWSPAAAGWLEALAAPLRRGVVLVFDYGYGEAEYYHPDRRAGTLGCHYRHRWHDDPLILPALQDITASVDFSALARAGDGAALERLGFTTQGWFLIGCGLTSLLAESDPVGSARYAALAGAAKQLTLPGEMGERVRVLALGRGLGEGAAKRTGPGPGSGLEAPGRTARSPTLPAPPTLTGFGEHRLDDRL